MMNDFELSDADAQVVAEICSKLDGNPLAIEFAAARVDALGVPGLAARLTDRFRLLTNGHRSTVSRHQTMSATLDWSYELLPEPERAVLRRVAVFAGDFAPETASVVAGDGFAASDVVDCVANLVAKSLVNADVFGLTVRYRLPETTRAYALEKLRKTIQSAAPEAEAPATAVAEAPVDDTTEFDRKAQEDADRARERGELTQPAGSAALSSSARSR